MSADDEATILRRRIAELENRFDQFRDISPGGNPAKLVSTTTTPTSAGLYGEVQETRPSGDEVEGGAVTVTQFGENFQAGNLGQTTPPKGTVAIAVLFSGRWIYIS